MQQHVHVQISQQPDVTAAELCILHSSQAQADRAPGTEELTGDSTCLCRTHSLHVSFTAFTCRWAKSDSPTSQRRDKESSYALLG